MKHVYVRVPEKVIAVRWDGENLGELTSLGITLGFHKLTIGDYIVKNRGGELEIHSEDDFRKYFKRDLIWDDNL